MQYVSSLGGPRIMLPTSNVERWMEAFGLSQSPEDGLYGLACSVNGYCGLITPWGTPLLIFGDDPADMFYIPNQFDGLFVRWVGADSLEQLVAFAIAESKTDSWDEKMKFEIVEEDMTVMDTCSYHNDGSSKIHISMRPGIYCISSRYAETSEIMAIIHRLDYLG